MMPLRATSPRLPRCHERVRAAAAAAMQRPRQGHRDPRVEPPDRRAAATTRRPARPAPPRRPGAAGRPATPTAPTLATATTAAGPPGHHPALAPRPARPPPRRRLPTPPTRPPPNAALHPRPGAAAGPGEQQLGLPACAWRTAHPRDQGRRVYCLGDSPRGWCRPLPRPGRRHMGDLPAQAHALWRSCRASTSEPCRS